MTDAGPPPLVALIDDDDDLRVATAQLLSLQDIDVRAFASGAAALAAIDADFPGVVVTDVRMPGMSGLEVFAALQRLDPELPVMLVTGHGDVPMAVDAIKAGAWDFLTKPFDPAALVAAVLRAGRARALTLENRRLRAIAAAGTDDALIGDSAAIVRLRSMIPMLADAALDVLIEGAVGTGKEHYARALHRAGRRGRHRFQTIDCATVPDALVERELFARGGAIERAHRGTLFLDHLSAASPDLQHRLARLVETRAIALDSRTPEPVDLRVIAAVDEDARDGVAPNLFHLLAGVHVRIPTLAERTGDIPLLVAHFAAAAAERHRCPLPAIAGHAHRLSARAWPGNVLQLEKAVERLCLGLDDDAPTGAEPMPLGARLDTVERALIVEAIRTANGEIGAAIHALGIPRKTFYYRVKRLGIDLRALRGR